MKLILISSDHELYLLCREILVEFQGSQWDLSVSEPSGLIPESDLYIWDFRPDLQTPARLSPSERQKHFFLVHRKHLKAFQDRTLMPDLQILLKPVTRAALAAFLGQAIARHRANVSASDLDLLRADRDEMFQCLIQANLKLQEYDQDRTNFLARAMHDFRAPLTALNGYCGLLLGGQLGSLSEDQKEVLQRMQRSARRLTRIATAMFQLSVGRNVETRPSPQRADMRDCIEQALHEVVPFAEEKQISVAVNLLPSPEALYFEVMQMEQVMVNLVDNACKFTPRFGSVEILGYPFFWDRRLASAIGPKNQLNQRLQDSRLPNCYRVDIQDSGPGIPPEHLESVFEEYTSYTGGQDRSGAGLGLAICKMILRQHRGRIWAESRNEGVVFSFVLPFQRPEQHLMDTHSDKGVGIGAS